MVPWPTKILTQKKLYQFVCVKFVTTTFSYGMDNPALAIGKDKRFKIHF